MLEDNPNKQITGQLPFRDYTTLLYEETNLKAELSHDLKIPLNPSALRNVTLHPNKFSSDVLRTLRLSFLSSKALIDNGGASFARRQDFKSPVDQESEKLSYDFLLNSLDHARSLLKSEDHYRQAAANIEIKSLSDFNTKNVLIMQADEAHVLDKNLSYLTKAREKALENFY